MEAHEAFDQAEALAILSQDYGLYSVFDALTHRLKFSAPYLTSDALSEESRELYAEWAPLAEGTDPYEVPAWAESILTAIENADEAP
jgi:hypothetical protein